MNGCCRRLKSCLLPAVGSDVGYEMFLYVITGCRETLHTSKSKVWLL